MTRDGMLWPQDRYGRILNAACDRDDLPAQVIETGEDALSLLIDRFGEALHSLYLAGPAARGRPGGARFVAILRDQIPGLGVDAFCTAAAHALRKSSPGVGALALTVHGWSDVFPTDGRFSYARFRLGVNSICLAGRDLNRLIVAQSLGAGVSNPPILEFDKRMRGLVHRLKAVSSDARIRLAARAASSAMLHTSFALIMHHEGVYSEDADIRASFAKLHFPEQERSIEMLERSVASPTRSALEALSMIDQGRSWLGPLCEDWLNEHNPLREKAIRVM